MGLPEILRQSDVGPLTQALVEAFYLIDLTAVAELQSDGKVEDRLRDDLMLAMSRAGHTVSKGGPNRFDLFAPGWAFELKMCYFGDHAYGLRGTKAGVDKLRRAAPEMTQVLGTVVSWHPGVIYPNARRCEHSTDRTACIRHWGELIAAIAGGKPEIHERQELVLFLVELPTIEGVA